MVVFEKPTAPVTEEQFEQLLKQDIPFEIVDGELRWMAPNTDFSHHDIGSTLLVEIALYLRQNAIGRAVMDNLVYILKRDEQGRAEITYIPDISFIRQGRVPQGKQRLEDGAPDLAVEVISESNTPNEMRRKTLHYRTYGGEEVWLIYPELKELHQIRRETPQNIRVFTEDDTLETPLFPGLQLSVSALFVSRRG